jgi:hypothetical protein
MLAKIYFSRVLVGRAARLRTDGGDGRSHYERADHRRKEHRDEQRHQYARPPRVRVVVPPAFR